MIPITEAARQLNTKPGTLRRYCKQGMPHQPGGRGRGKPVMIDLNVCREWIGAPPNTQLALTLANDVQRLLAASVWKTWSGNVKLNHRREALIYLDIWYTCATGLLDHLRKQNSEVPDVAEPYPAEIEKLLKIARGD